MSNNHKHRGFGANDEKSSELFKKGSGRHNNKGSGKKAQNNQKGGGKHKKN